MKGLRGFSALIVVATVALFATMGRPQNTGGGQGGGGGSGTVNANSGVANEMAIYPAAGGSTTVGPDATLVDNGAALTYSGTTGIVAPAGTSTAPAYAFTGALTTGPSLAAANIAGITSNGVLIAQFTGGIEVTQSGSFKASQTGLATGAVGVSLAPVGTGTTEAWNVAGTSTGLFVLTACKIGNTPITLTTQTTICSFSLPNSGQTLSWQCQGTYSTTTTTITFTLGMIASQTPTAAATGSAVAYTAVATAPTWATVSDAGTTATPILAVTPATATSNLPWTSTGTIPANAAAGTLILYGTASTTSDVTVLGTCLLY